MLETLKWCRAKVEEVAMVEMYYERPSLMSQSAPEHLVLLQGFPIRWISWIVNIVTAAWEQPFSATKLAPDFLSIIFAPLHPLFLCLWYHLTEGPMHQSHYIIELQKFAIWLYTHFYNTLLSSNVCPTDVIQYMQTNYNLLDLQLVVLVH